MTVEFMIGFGVAFVLGLVIALVYYYKQGARKYYDERQMAIRGIGYRYGMMTIVTLQFACIFLKEGSSLLDRFEWDLVIFVTMIIGLLVFIVYSILNDSYLGVRYHVRGYVGLCVVIIAVNLPAVHRTFDALRSGDTLTFMNSVNLVNVFTFVVMLGTLIIRHIQVKSDEE